MKTFEQYVQDALGAQVFTICRLQAENEALRARIAELEHAAATNPPPAP